MNITFKVLGIDLNQNIPGSCYFYWKEALWLPKVSAFAIPTKQQMSAIINQAQYLDPIRKFFGEIIDVTSWLRPQLYNRLIDGAPDSSHLRGSATDFTIRNVSIEEAKKEIQANNLYPGGGGEINTTNWIHLDREHKKWFIA